jgi:pyrroline-5-carboxylate reductase
MRVALVGRGRLASSLLPALQRAGHQVVSVNSRTLAELPQNAEVCIISVKDSALQEVISQVACRTVSPVFLHTAGSMPMTVFEGHARRYGVFYPMQTFSKERQVDFSSIPTFI